jgi:hypothetical protein
MSKKLLTAFAVAAISFVMACSSSGPPDGATVSSRPPDEARVKATLDQWLSQEFASERGTVANIGPLFSKNEGEIEVNFTPSKSFAHRATFRRAQGGKWYLAEVINASKAYQPNLEVK